MLPQFRHKFVSGFTGTGKSTLVKERVRHYLAHKQQVIVFPGTGDTDFTKGCAFVWSADELEERLGDQKSYGSFVVLDECAALYDDVSRKNHPIVNGLFMRGRHLGYTCWAITQYTRSIPRKVRINCTERYLFGVSDYDEADTIAKDCNNIMVEGKPLRDAIMQLNRFEYFRYIHPGQITKHMTVKR